jgi:hypothetical protein
VGDDQRRASLHQPLERLLHQPLAFGVERAGRLVEQQDRRVAQQRAGDRDALALPAREPRPALAEEGVEPCGSARRKSSALAARAASQIASSLASQLP